MPHCHTGWGLLSHWSSVAMRSIQRFRWITCLFVTLLSLSTSVSLPHALDHADTFDQDLITLAKLHQQILRDVPHPRVSPVELATQLLDVATTYQLDPFVLLGLIKTESSYDPQATSPVGALGLTQMMPAMIKHYGMTTKTFLACLRCQLELGAQHLTYLLNRFDGRQDLALLSYHGSLTPSQSRYVLRIHRTARQSSHSPDPHSLTLPNFGRHSNTTTKRGSH